MAFCRKLCCCDWSEDKNQQQSQNQQPNLVELKQQKYSPNNTSANASGNINANSNNNLTDPLVGMQSPGGTITTSSSLTLDLSQPSLTSPRGAGGEPGSPGSPLSPGGLKRKRSISWAPKGYDTPKAVQPSAVKGIYRHVSSYGGDRDKAGMMGKISDSGSAAGSVVGYHSPAMTASSTGDITGGREPPDLSLL